MQDAFVFLMTAVGSYGDVVPHILLGQALQARGHRVEVVASAHFAPLIRKAGLVAHAIGEASDYTDALHDARIVHPVKAFKVLSAAMGRFFSPIHGTLRARCVPGKTVLVTGLLGVVPRAMQEQEGWPCVMLHPAPAVFRSRHAQPRMLAYDSLPYWPGCLRPPMWWLADRLLDPAILPIVNPGRAALGLPPVRRFFHRWLHQADLQLALFPPWFAPPQPDWPANTRQTGFLLPGAEAAGSLAPAVQAFLQAGEAPVVFSAGTASATNADFFAASVEACQRAGLRGIVLTPHAAQLPARLPAQVAHFDTVPFDALLPRAAVFVHHGGIGSSAEAMRAGVPQLVRPVAFDQFDNSTRLCSLGVAEECLPGRYRPAHVARQLKRLCVDPAIREACRREAGRMQRENGLAAACETLLAFARERLGNPG